MPELYAIELLHGIKIGYSKDPDSRVKQHKSLGAPTKVIKTIKIPSKDIDIEFKKLMKELNLIESIPDNDKATEVYRLTTVQAIALLNYVEAFQTINRQAIIDVLNGDGVVKQHNITLAEICVNYGSKYKRPMYQRDVDPKRVLTIKNFILDNYNNRCFYLPNILLARSNEENERYLIIDGQHRCAAISAIPKTHPCMTLTVHVVIYPVLTVNEQLQLFRDVNQSVPVPKIYLEPTYIIDLQKAVCARLNKEYGVVVNWNKIANKFSSEIHHTAITALITNGVINILLDNSIILGISDKDVFNFFVEFNEYIAKEITDAAGVADYLTNPSADIDATADHAAVLEYCNKINESDYAMKNLTIAIHDIRKKRKKPFVLGLIVKVPLIAAYCITSGSDATKLLKDIEKLESQWR